MAAAKEKPPEEVTKDSMLEPEEASIEDLKVVKACFPRDCQNVASEEIDSILKSDWKPSIWEGLHTLSKKVKLIQLKPFQ